MGFLGIVFGMMLDVIVVPNYFIGRYSRNILIAITLGAVSGVVIHILTSFFGVTQMPMELVVPRMIAGCLWSIIFCGAIRAFRMRKGAKQSTSG
jgi:cell shape-determining protein MreD